MGEIIGIRKNGEPFPCEFASAIFKDINGEDKTSTVLIDISKRRKFEQEKNFEQRDKEALINSVGDLIWSVDTDMKLIAGNDAFKQSLKGACGVDFNQGDYLLGTEYFPEEFINNWKALYVKALLGTPFKEEIYVAKLKDTEANWSEISFNPIYNEDKITGIACYARNITERKENELELRRLHIQLLTRLKEIAEANKELRKIAWTQSHMVRAPLARIMGFVELLSEDCNTDDMGKFLGYIKDASAELDNVIRDIVKKAEKANTVLPITDAPLQYL
ncbi:MAG: PAS domain-containing protein [Sphingobacteriales bacterium JAD_PAG50586_3]|nr:MAG: PAS domain-containing protein [Sphingobacteriales bacterium JAD_PAG50586_3]